MIYNQLLYYQLIKNKTEKDFQKKLEVFFYFLTTLHS